MSLNVVMPTLCFRAALIETFLNDITVPQAHFDVAVHCRRSFSVACTLYGSDKTIGVRDVLVANGSLIFETVIDLEGELPITTRLTDFGKLFLREVADSVRQELGRAAAA